MPPSKDTAQVKGEARAEIERFLRSCKKRGLRVTPQRRLIIETLLKAQDHPDAATLHERVRKRNPAISAATVYRTLNLLEQEKILLRHDFHGDSAARYELAGAHHDHLIDLQNGAVVEFYDEELEALQEQIAGRLGFQLVNHHMILYGGTEKRGTEKRWSKKARQKSFPAQEKSLVCPPPALVV